MLSLKSAWNLVAVVQRAFCLLSESFLSFIPTTILSPMRSYPSFRNSQYSARQYTNMLCNYPLTHHLIDFSGRTWLVQILRFSLPRNELQTCLSPRCTALLLQLTVRMTLRCRQLLRLSCKSKYLLGSRRLHGRVQSLSEIVRNARSNRIILWV